jgi:lipopolysaccharide transport system permease protein
MSESTIPITVIERKKGWIPIDLKQIWKHRELLYFFTVRDLKVRYKQTVLGCLWAIVQPLVTMAVFTLFFGRLGKMPSDGLPYPIFVFSGLLAWTYFANALNASSGSLVGSSNLITKASFPRLIVPVSACLPGLVDFLIAFTILIAMMIYYHVCPGMIALLAPLLVALTFLCAVGFGLWLSALNVQYRDIRYVIPFLIQLWLFVSPVIYPLSMVKEDYQWLLALNPLGGIIKAFRAALLGHAPVDWMLLGLSIVTILAVFVTGLSYFRKVERNFADII